MDFATILTDMFPQVRRNIIEDFIDQVGNTSEEQFNLIIDLILVDIKENIDIHEELAKPRFVIATSNDNIKEQVNLSTLQNASVVRKLIPQMRLRRQVNHSTTVRSAHSTGAIPKQHFQIRNKSSSSTTNNNTKNVAAKGNIYSKMTLVRNVVPTILDDNDKTDWVAFTAIEEKNEIFERFLNMLPQADPTYLREKANFFRSLPTESVDEFVLERIEKKDYPSIDEYLGKLDEINNKKAYTANFNVHKFIKQFPNAPEYFAAIENPYSTDEEIINSEHKCALGILLNKYRRMRMNDVEKIYKRSKYNLIKTCDLLNRSKGQLFEDRPLVEENVEECSNLGFVQILAYIKHRNEIDSQVFAEADRLEFERAEATASNSFLTCACCYRDDLLTEDCVTCIEGCLFCKECVKTGAEYCLAEAKTLYTCLSNCESTFTDGTLQSVLSTITYQRLTQRRQIEEVAEANIPGLETCPFCDYATIPAEEDKIFQCENIDCKKISCRKCRHESHLPLRCNEIEYDEDVRMRIEIENKMSEAMLRFKCVACQKPIIKEAGCNKITCPCGRISCYVCKQAIANYHHFESGGCQLWENAEVTRADILKQANQAKEALGINADPEKLKFDPTLNF